MVRYMVEKIKDLYQLQQIFFEGGQIAKLVNIIYIIGRNKKEPRPADRPDVSWLHMLAQPLTEDGPHIETAMGQPFDIMLFLEFNDCIQTNSDCLYTLSHADLRCWIHSPNGDESMIRG